MTAINEQAIATFRKTVYDHYYKHGRHDLPWRKTTDPYHILVSEIMLQQTQVPRVILKYTEFIRRFTNTETLAKASTKDLLETWQGLGYNRRALMLQKMASEIVSRYAGEIPRTESDLLSLPGIGPYTAAAVMAFAFDQPSLVIDTNIRSVLIHHFFTGRDSVSDNEIRPVVQATLDSDHPRAWYSALMDYGTHLKSTGENPGRRSAHHTRQSPFEGSDRQIRGRILRLLIDNGHMSQKKLIYILKEKPNRIERIISGLCSEGFMEESNQEYTLTESRINSTQSE